MATARKIVSKEFNVYQLNFTAVAPAGTSTQSINIQAEADFLLEKLCYFADVAAADQTDSTRVIPLATILVTDTGTKRQLMNTAVPIPSLFGVGEIPFILPQPKLFNARSAILVQVTNFNAATTYNIRLSFIGTDIFYAG